MSESKDHKEVENTHLIGKLNIGEDVDMVVGQYLENLNKKFYELDKRKGKTT